MATAVAKGFAYDVLFDGCIVASSCVEMYGYGYDYA